MLLVHGNTIGRQVVKHLSLVLVLFICSEYPSPVNGAKGALRMVLPPFSNETPIGMYVNFHGIEYRESSKIHAKSPRYKFYYFQTDKTKKEFLAAVKNFGKRVFNHPEKLQNGGPILRKLGYNLKYKDDTLLFSTAEERKKFGNSYISSGTTESNEGYYDMLKKKGIKVEYARKPAPGLLIFPNPEELERARAILFG